MKKVLFQLLLLLTICINNSCKKEKPIHISPPLPTVPIVLLKEINIPNQPSPFYRFEYNNAGQPSSVSSASGLFTYNIIYSGGNIHEMQNEVAVNKDRLQYAYDNSGMVNTIWYTDSNGVVYNRVHFQYEQQKLTKAERERKFGNNFILEKTLSFSYYPDGNLKERKDHRYPVNGQIESTYIDRFEQYDNKINTDAFTLLHNEFFEHLYLLPRVQLQINNPGKLTRSGDGINYQIIYTYTYDNKNCPLSKTGEVTITSTPDAGVIFQTNAFFSYY